MFLKSQSWFGLCLLMWLPVGFSKASLGVWWQPGPHLGSAAGRNPSDSPDPPDLGCSCSPGALESLWLSPNVHVGAVCSLLALAVFWTCIQNLPILFPEECHKEHCIQCSTRGVCCALTDGNRACQRALLVTVDVWVQCPGAPSAQISPALNKNSSHLSL